MQDEIFEALKQVLVEKLKVEGSLISNDADLFGGLGLDSIDLATAIMSIEERFEIQISDRELETVTTVGQAVALIGSKVALHA